MLVWHTADLTRTATRPPYGILPVWLPRRGDARDAGSNRLQVAGSPWTQSLLGLLAPGSGSTARPYSYMRTVNHFTLITNTITVKGR